MNIKLIVNPAAGKGSALKKSNRVIAELNRRDVEFDVEYTTYPRHGAIIAKEAAKSFEKVIALGGDGTANEVGEGVVGTDAIFGVIPSGSGNDFAKMLNISNIDNSIDTLLNGKIRNIDVIKVNDRISLNTTGVGFNGVVSDVAGRVKFLRGISVYIYSVIKTAIRYKAIPMRITVDDMIVEDNIFMVSVCNSKSEGGGFIVAPDAEIDDGILDVTIIREASLFKLLLNIKSAMTGNLNKLDEVDTIRGENITIESDYPMPLHVDGEVVSMTSGKISASILKGALKVLSN